MTGPNPYFQISEDVLQTLRDGLKMWAVEGEITFDRPTPLRRMCTATLRGLAGTRLIEESPEIFARAFKPVQGEHTPPAYLFQSRLNKHECAEVLPFRLITWDAEHKLMEHLMVALSHAKGSPFGESGSLVRTCTWSTPFRRPFTGWKARSSSLKLHLKTPLQIRKLGRIVPEPELSLGHLVLSAQKRINLLSQHYGNGLSLPAGPFLEEAALARETSRHLREVLPMRRSCTQQNTISLRGITGSLTYTGISPMVTDLLSVAETLHLGRHTAEGCGQVILKPLKTPNPQADYENKIHH